MYTFTLNGRSSVLSSKLYPPIILDDKKTWVLSLIDFVTYNTIPNVDTTNNKFHIDKEVITLPEGCYEISDIEQYILEKIQEKQKEIKERRNIIANTVSTNTNVIVKEVEKADKIFLSMKTNHNTLRFEIKSNKIIHFDKKDSIAPLLGFEKKRLSPNKLHISTFPINISKVNSFCINCNLVTNSYNNDSPVHLLHM